MLAQGAGIDLGRSGDISDELLILRIVVARTRDDHRFTHRRMAGDLSFDLAKFDTEAANLDLMIVTAEELEIAIGAIACEIARAIHARTLNERIVEETLGGEISTIQIATRHTRTTDVKLTHRTNRHQLMLRIEQIDARIGNGTADRHQIRFFRKASIRGCPYRRFRRTVFVIERYGSRQRRALPREIRGTRFTCDDDLPKLMLTARRHTVENGLTERRDTQYACDVAIPHQLDDCVRIPRSVDIDKGETASVRERPEEAGDRAVERERRKQQEALVRRALIELVPGESGCGQRPMFDRNALGLAGGAGGVDHIGEVMRGDSRLRIVLRECVIERCIGIEHG
ncbi:hypothetical protein BGLT_02939 [Caballeronia glathei]|nr:hypothetical protein BGLT_02939 [Caballeronia glathei]